MLSMEDDGTLQVTAGLTLLENSRLLEWSSSEHKFVALSRELFERTWQDEVDPVFGRIICWINFSAGAEFFAKGVCLLQGIELREPKDVPLYPTHSIDQWAAIYPEGWQSLGTIPVTNFGTLRNLTVGLGNESHLLRLCRDMSASEDERRLLIAAYELLRHSIRNRDVHAYIPNVRDSHYNLVPNLFVRCLNILASWLPGGSQNLTAWKFDAASLVSQHD